MSRSGYRLIGPYSYDDTHRWDEYLLDIRETLEEGMARQAASAQAGASAFAEAEEAGLRAMDELSSRLEQGFEELRAEFNWGFTLMVDRLAKQTSVLQDVCSKLDETNEKLSLPLRIKARELFNEGQVRLQKDLLDKALKRFLQAEQENEVDFPLQLQIGTLYLYGRNKEVNVINYSEAERHFVLAARYARAEQHCLQDWRALCDRACFHAGVAAYLQGQEEKLAGRVDGMRTCLERTAEHASAVIELWPRFTEGPYLRAKCMALLGRNDEALGELRGLVDRDRRYIGKAKLDGDFSSIRAAVDDLATQVFTDPGPVTSAVLHGLATASEAISMEAKGKLEPEELSRLKMIERRIETYRRLAATLDVDMERLRGEVASACEVLANFRLDALLEANKRDVLTALGRERRRVKRPIAPQAPKSAMPAEELGLVKDLVGRGDTIGAIKLVRERTGWDIRKAEEFLRSLRPREQRSFPD